MKTRVIQMVATTSLFFLVGGCATTASRHGFTHTDAEVTLALQHSERSTLTRLSDSMDPATSEAARRIALGESR